MMRAALIVWGAWVPCAPSMQEQPPSEVECRWTEDVLRLDGETQEKSWQAAPVVGGFCGARLLWDRQFLHFAAEMKGPKPPADDEAFLLLLKPAAEAPGYYEFQVTAGGAAAAFFHPQRGGERSKGGFAAAAKGTASGWSVEGKIPWRDFLRTGGRPEPGQKWSFALARRGLELSTHPPLKGVDLHRHEDYATLRFAFPNSRRIPWTTSRVRGSPDPPLPYRARRAFEKLKLARPITVVREPGTDDLLLAEQLWAWTAPGRILRLKDEQAQEILSLDRTPIGLAFHPDYRTNGYLYVESHGPVNSTPRTTRVSRFTVDRRPPHAIDARSEQIVLEWESDGHNGGDLAFGPDGMLYVSAGDGSSDSDKNLTGQDLGKLTAKILRIDVVRPAEGRAYSIPKDNPFLDIPGARPETWAYGFRNPWRIAFDSKTGHLWVGNNGQDLWEQVYLVRRGENYGWSLVEGSHPFYPNRKQGPHPIRRPVVDHPHSEMRSLTGGIVYDGSRLPELRGAYVYGDWSTGRIWGLRHDGVGVTWHRELARTTLQISGFGTDAKGELLVVDHGGALYRLEPTPKEDVPPPPFPTRLSDTGLFRSVPAHEAAPGLISYSVNAPLWSDEAAKERHLAIPHKEGEDRRIDLTSSRGWEFPEGTVLVKSFALDGEKGRRWIETRLLTKQDGQWAGYSYAWDDGQTDAVLVESGGLDKTFGSLKWRYPSRAECMVCHTRAANFVLGLSTLQMNKAHDAGGGADNQLRSLERLGLLRVNWMAEEREAVRSEAVASGVKESEAEARAEAWSQTKTQRAAGPSALLTRAPDQYPRLVDPYDPSQNLDARARSYLHSNCAQCHVETGGGNAMMELEFTTPRDRMNVVGVPPLHDTFGIEGARLVAPGHPERSVLYERLKRRGAGQMPPLATTVADAQAVRVLHDWIKSREP